MLNLLLVLFLSISHAALTEPDRAEFVHKNLLKDQNPGGENGKAKWIISGGAFTSETSTTHIYTGNASIKFSPSGSSQFIRTGGASVHTGVQSTNGLGMCAIKTTNTDSTLSIYDGTATLASTTITASNKFIVVPLNFIFSTNSPTQIRITSGSGLSDIYIDDCYIGPAFNIASITEAKFVGSSYFDTTANCQWERTNTALGAFGTDTDCPGPTIESEQVGDWLTTDADLPQQTINSLPPGIYEVKITALISDNTGAGTSNSITISDGTTTSGRANMAGDTSGQDNNSLTIIGYFSYTSSGNRTFAVHGSSAGGATIQLRNATANAQTRVFITRYPISTELIYKPDQQPASWSGYHDTDCAWTNTTTGSAFQSPSADASCTFTQRTNRNFGTVSSTGAKTPGISFTPAKSGMYHYCVNGSMSETVSSTTITVQALDGSSNVIGAHSYGSGTTTERIPFAFCGVLSASSTSVQSINLQLKRTTGSAGTQTLDTGGSAVAALQWTLFAMDQSTASPYLVNSIVSTYQGVTALEVSDLNCDAGSVINSQHGSWVSSIGNISSGACAVTLTTGIFSSAPYCNATKNGGTPTILNVSAGSATSVTVDCILDTGADCTAYDFILNCVGPK